VAYRAGSDLVGKAAFFLVTVAAARRLSQDAFGDFSLGSTLGWMAAVTADFGLQLHLAREVARRPSEAGRLLRRWLTIRLWSGLVVFVGIVAGIAVLRPTGDRAAAVILLSATYLVAGLIEFLHYFYRGLSRSDLESTLTLILRLGTLGLALIALWWRPDVAWLSVAILLPTVLTFGYSVRLANRVATSSGAAPAEVGARAPGVTGEILRDVAPIGVGIVLSALYFRIDVFLIEMWSGGRALALYNAVFRLIEALRLFPAALLAVALPSLCRATSLRPVIRMSAGLLAFSAAVTGAVWLTSGWVVPFVYGTPYAAAVPALRILAIGFPLMSINYALTHQLIGWNGHRAYAAICAAALLFNVVLNSRLIPAWSIEGAAWATVWTEVILSAGCLLALSVRAARTEVVAPIAWEASS
jgi:O-antigen/teichoic acid export membrane protein